MVDDAQILRPDEVRAVSATCRTLQMSTGRQLAVVTVRSLGGHTIEDYGLKLGNYWGVGRKGLDDGVLLLIAPNEPRGKRGPRIEVGGGLESVLTDAEAKAIIDDAIMPELRAGHIAKALSAGADAIVRELAVPERKAA